MFIPFQNNCRDYTETNTGFSTETRKLSDTGIAGAKHKEKSNDDEISKRNIKARPLYRQAHEEADLDSAPQLFQESLDKCSGNLWLQI